MHELIITRILNRGVVTLSELETRSKERGLSLSELYAALDKVSRDKRIKRGVRQGDVYYEPAPAAKPPTYHLAWVRQWYIDNPYHCTEVPFPEIDYSHLFLKTKEERDLFISEMKGRPMMYNKKRYEH